MALCGCNGCHSRGGTHLGACETPAQNGCRYGGYCKACHRFWLCPACGTVLRGSPSGDLVAACRHCAPAPPAVCSCSGCPSHADAVCHSSCEPGSVYCCTCEPLWRCACRLRSCWHHRHSAQCSSTIVWGEHRLAAGLSVNICDRCSAQYCGCVSPSCLGHGKRRCGRCRQIGTDGRCLACLPNPKRCLCSGCGACSSDGCERSFVLTARGRNVAACVACAVEALRSWALKLSLEMALLTSAGDAVSALLAEDQKTFTGARLLRARALQKVFCAHVLSMLVVDCGPHADLGAAPPQYVLLRALPAQEWVCRDFKMFWYDHVATCRKSKIMESNCEKHVV